MKPTEPTNSAQINPARPSHYRVRLTLLREAANLYNLLLPPSTELRLAKFPLIQVWICQSENPLWKSTKMELIRKPINWDRKNWRHQHFHLCLYSWCSILCQDLGLGNPSPPKSLMWHQFQNLSPETELSLRCNRTRQFLWTTKHKEVKKLGKRRGSSVNNGWFWRKQLLNYPREGSEDWS